MKAMIVYGTRYGATAGTSEEIAEVLRHEGFEVKVVNAKKEKIKDISEYELIIVASGMKIGRWTKEPEKFLDNFSSQLALLHKSPMNIKMMRKRRSMRGTST
jgi:menaquinone-dependent protoporphyrinogen oxidase